MNQPKIQSPHNVEIAYNRISNYLNNTPVIQSDALNKQLEAELYFKVDALQKTGAFKVRGVLNHLLELQEFGRLPNKVVAYTTGNHGIGVSWAANLLGIKARIYFPSNTSKVKRDAASILGSEVIVTETRQQAEYMTKQDSLSGEFYYLHPSDSDATIAGAGTMCYEAIKQLDCKPDAIFASCGGGGLLSGSYLAKELLSPNSLLIGTEPLEANDAFLSRQQNEIYAFDSSPNTIADGLRTLKLSSRTFEYIKKLDDFYLATEEEIIYWTNLLASTLNIKCEPSCALNMSGVLSWIKSSKQGKKILVLISGGNIDYTKD